MPETKEAPLIVEGTVVKKGAKLSIPVTLATGEVVFITDQVLMVYMLGATAFVYMAIMGMWRYSKRDPLSSEDDGVPQARFRSTRRRDTGTRR